MKSESRSRDEIESSATKDIIKDKDQESNSEESEKAVEEDEEEKILSNSSTKSSNSSGKKRKVDEIMDENKTEANEAEDLDNQGFFDEEAELSGKFRFKI